MNLKRSKYKLAILLDGLMKIRHLNMKSTFKQLLKAVSLTTPDLRPLASFLCQTAYYGQN